MAETTVTLGAAATTETARLLFAPPASGREVPASLMAGSAVGYVRQAFVFGSGFLTPSLRGQVHIYLNTADSGTGAVSGPELSDAVEGLQEAFTFSVAGSDFVIRGPTATGSSITDSAEPYIWRPDQDSVIDGFISAYNAATTAQRAATTLKIQDSVAAAPSWTDDTGDPISGTVGEAIVDVTVPAVDVGDPAPTYAAVGDLPAGVRFNTSTRVLSFDEDAIEAGSGTIRIRATNSEGTDDWTVDYTFAPNVVAPEFADDTGDALSGETGTAIATVTIPRATGMPDPTYSQIGATPSGLTVTLPTTDSDGSITGTPDAAGSGTIRIRATNSEGSDDWTVAYEFIELSPELSGFSATGTVYMRMHVTAGSYTRGNGQVNLWASDLWTADGDAGQVGTLVSGSPTISGIAGNAPTVRRFAKWSNGDRLILNSQGGDLNEVLDDATDPVLTIVRQTSAGYELHTHSPTIHGGTSFVDWRRSDANFSDEEWNSVDAIADGDWVILAIHDGVASYTPPPSDELPIAGRAVAPGGSGEAALIVREAGVESVAGRVEAPGGSAAAALTVQGVEDAEAIEGRVALPGGSGTAAVDVQDVADAESITARAVLPGGRGTVALTAQEIADNEPVAGRAVSAGGRGTAAVGIRAVAGAAQIAARAASPAGRASIAVNVRSAGTQSLAGRTTSPAGRGTAALGIAATSTASIAAARSLPGGRGAVALTVRAVADAQSVAGRAQLAGGRGTVAVDVRALDNESVAGEVVSPGGSGEAALAVRAVAGIPGLNLSGFSATGTIHMWFRFAAGSYTRGNGQVNLWASDLWTADGDAGQVGTLLEGSPAVTGIAGNAPVIRRVARWDRAGGLDDRAILNDNADAGDIGALLDEADDPYRVTIVRETSGGFELLTLPVPSSGGGENFVDWRTSSGSAFTNAMFDSLDAIEVDDEVIVALHQGVASYTPPAGHPLAGEVSLPGGSGTAAVDVQDVADAESITARAVLAGGRGAAALTVRDVADDEPIAARSVSPGGRGTVAVGIAATADAAPLAARATFPAGRGSVEVDVRSPGVEPVAVVARLIGGRGTGAVNVDPLDDPLVSLAARATYPGGRGTVALAIRAVAQREHTVTGIWRAFEGGFALGSQTSTFTPADGRELPSAWVVGGVGFVRSLWIEESGGSARLTLQIDDQDTGLGSATGPQFVDDVEDDLTLTLHSPGETFETDLSRDPTEPYIFFPPALQGFLDTLSEGEAGSLVFELGNFEVAGTARLAGGRGVAAALTVRDVADAEPIAARARLAGGRGAAAVDILPPGTEQIAALARLAGGRGSAALRLAEGILQLTAEATYPGGRGNPVALTVREVADAQPIAGEGVYPGGRGAAALIIRPPGTQPVAGRLIGLGGSGTAEIVLVDVAGNEPLAGRGVAGPGGFGTAALDVRSIAAGMLAGRVVLPGGRGTVELIVSDLSVPRKIVGFETIPGDGYIDLMFEALDAQGYPLSYEYQLEDGTWVEFTPT